MSSPKILAFHGRTRNRPSALLNCTESPYRRGQADDRPPGRQHVREAWKSPRFERLISGSGCSSVRLLLSWPKNVGPYTRDEGLTHVMGELTRSALPDLYRRAGQTNILASSAMLGRHAMTLINPTIQSAEYARAKQQMAALADVGEEESMTGNQEAR